MSEKAKATPTPWRAEYDPPEVMMGGHKREWKVLGQLEGFGTAQYVASCFHFPQSQANTELIVAAVNSHDAALELALAVLTGDISIEGNLGHRELARKVLGKEGELE